MILKHMGEEHSRDKGRGVDRKQGRDRELDGVSGQDGVTPQVGDREQDGDMGRLEEDVEVFGGNREALGRDFNCPAF
jgi:hypothetical protein